MAYYWPGFPQLWIRGSWAGLLVAVGFTALLNILLLATLLFTEWLTLETRLIGFGVLAAGWLLARWQSRAERRGLWASHEEDEQQDGLTEQHLGDLAAERDRNFREVQGFYLRNDWVAAEQSLLKLLKQDARDVESRLMLATLWRHQQRSAEALRQLDRLERLEAAAKWQHEITAERAAITGTDEDSAEESGAEENSAEESGVEENNAEEFEAGDDQNDHRDAEQCDAPREWSERESTENNDHHDNDQQLDQRQAA